MFSQCDSPGFHPPSAPENLIPSSRQHIGRRYTTQRLVITPEVVATDELTDRNLQIFRRIVWRLVDVSFQRLVVPLQLPVSASGGRVVR